MGLRDFMRAEFAKIEKDSNQHVAMMRAIGSEQCHERNEKLFVGAVCTAVLIMGGVSYMKNDFTVHALPDARPKTVCTSGPGHAASKAESCAVEILPQPQSVPAPRG